MPYEPLRTLVLTLTFWAIAPAVANGQAPPDAGGSPEQPAVVFPLALDRPAPDVVADDWYEKEPSGPIGKVIRQGGSTSGGLPLGELPEDLERKLADGLKDLGRAMRAGKKPGSLANYHGDVVVVHVIDWQQPATGEDLIERMKLVASANEDRGIQLLGIMPAGDDSQERARKAGVDWPVALTSLQQSACQYVVMSARSRVFVVGRSGELVWHGDASFEGAFPDALAKALDRVALERIENDLVRDLDDALRDYYGGEVSKAVSEAKKVQANGERSEQPAHVRDATYLLNQARATEASWMQIMRKAAGRRADFDRYLRYVDALIEGFPRTAGKEARQHEKDTARQGSNASRLRGERRWLKCAAQRPALFPARKDKDGDRFAKKVEKFVAKTRDAAQATRRGQDLLDRYRAAVE